MKYVKRLYGVDLTTVTKANKQILPVVVDKCVKEIEKRGQGRFEKRGQARFEKRGQGRFEKRGQGRFEKRGQLGGSLGVGGVLWGGGGSGG